MASTAPPSCCAPHWVREVDALRRQGVDLDLVEVSSQCFAHVRGLVSPTPPWERGKHDIVIALAAADGASLDAFYLELPYKFNGGAHNRVGGQVVTYDGRQWQLVSWHYPDGKPWRTGKDDLATHIQHCRGFFLGRGAVNAR